VYLAGAGFRGAGLLTRKALRLLQPAGAVNDRLIGAGILPRLRARLAEGVEA
jgi:siroheme synthase